MLVTFNLLTRCIILEGLSFHHHHSGHLKSYKWSWVYKNNCCFKSKSLLQLYVNGTGMHIRAWIINIFEHLMHLSVCLLVSAPFHDSKHEDYCCLGYCSCICPADKGSIILRNVGTLHPGYTVQHPRKQQSWKFDVWNFSWKLLGYSRFSCFDAS